MDAQRPMYRQMSVIFYLCDDQASKLPDHSVFDSFDTRYLRYLDVPKGPPTLLQQELLFQVQHAWGQLPFRHPARATREVSVDSW